MSYCRFTEDSDVYVFPSVYGGIECCACSLSSPGKNVSFPTQEEMIEHLREHQDTGDLVPGYAFERLQREINER